MTIAPLKPSELPVEPRELALKIVESAARLGALRLVTAQAIADFLRPSYSYYPNLIEGHDTHLLAIAQVPRAEYALDSRNRLLQLEVLAHIEVHKQLPALLATADASLYQERFWRAVYEAFYAHRRAVSGSFSKLY